MTDLTRQALLSGEGAAYLSLHTGPLKADGWAWAETLPTVTHRSTWLPAEPRDVLVAVAEPITTYPRWAGGLYAAAQLRDAAYRAAVARWVENTR